MTLHLPMYYLEKRIGIYYFMVVLYNVSAVNHSCVFDIINSNVVDPRRKRGSFALWSSNFSPSKSASYNIRDQVVCLQHGFTVASKICGNGVFAHLQRLRMEPYTNLKTSYFKRNHRTASRSNVSVLRIVRLWTPLFRHISLSG